MTYSRPGPWAAAPTQGATAANTRIDRRMAQSPLLMQLAQQAHLSAQLLERVQPLLPPTLRSLVRAGPLQGDQWCVIVPNAAAAAKLRQLMPLLQAELARPQPHEEGPPLPAIAHIRLRVADS